MPKLFVRRPASELTHLDSATHFGYYDTNGRFMGWLEIPEGTLSTLIGGDVAWVNVMLTTGEVIRTRSELWDVLA